jgi:hypothetical protein
MRNIRKKTIFRFVFGIILLFGPIMRGAEPIDIVYTWVDGADPAWQEVRDRYFREYFPLIANKDAATRNRFRNRDELRYSMRSLLKYAPFFNHIYIVTFQQRPKWLIDNPKVTIVDHQEIFPDKSHLPTFNSQAIECNLHRIPNLSEKFIYFNDDVLLGEEMKENDFFTSKGNIRCYLSQRLAPTKPPIPGECAYDSAWKNTREFLDQEFRAEPRFKLAHGPFALKKSLIEEVEGVYPGIFSLVSSHRFRVPNDYVMTNGLIQYFAYYTKRAKMERQSGVIIHIYPSLEATERQISKFFANPHPFFCVEDNSVEDSPEVDQRIHAFLEKLFPEPAPWEAEADATEEEEMAASTPESENDEGTARDDD